MNNNIKRLLRFNSINSIAIIIIALNSRKYELKQELKTLLFGRRPIFAHNLLNVKAVIMLNVMDLTIYSAVVRDEKFTIYLHDAAFIISFEFLLYKFRLSVNLYVSIVFAAMIMQRIPRDIGGY